MASIYDTTPEELIEKLSEELKTFKEIKAPIWATFVKTGVFKERPPVKEDWWYTRSAAVLRSVAKLGPIGTSKLRRKYGGIKNRGVRPEHFYKGSGNIIRKVLQQLETAGLIEQGTKGTHKGRIVTPKGVSVMEKIAAQLNKGRKTVNVKETEVKKEPKTEKVKEVKKEVKVKENVKVKETKSEKPVKVAEEVKEPVKEAPKVKEVKTEEPKVKGAVKEEKPVAVEKKPEVKEEKAPVKEEVKPVEKEIKTEEPNPEVKA